MKKLLSIILAILMIVSTVPMVFAAECEHPYDPNQVVRQNLTYVCGECGAERQLKSADYTECSLYANVLSVYYFRGAFVDDDLQDQFKKDINVYRDAIDENYPFYWNIATELEQDVVDAVAQEYRKMCLIFIEKFQNREYGALYNSTMYDYYKAELDVFKLKNNLTDDQFDAYAIEVLSEERFNNVNNYINENLDKAYEAVGASDPDGFTVYSTKAGEACRALLNCLEGTHNYVYEVSQPATCTENADERGICSLCGDIDMIEVADSALGHDIIIDEPVAPTCNQTGLTVGQHCSRCDGATIAQEVIPATGEHIDADGDEYCDGCGEQLICEDCGRPVHDDSLAQNLICLIIMFIRLVKSMFA